MNLVISILIRKEVIRIRQSSFLKAVNHSFYFVASRIVLFVCFITYIYTGGRLTAEAVFVTMAFFNTMRITVTKHFPTAIAATAELMVACNRIKVLFKK